MEVVYLLSYSSWGHHSGAFYRNDELVEFTYGDWELFALNKRDAWTAWKNMTFLTDGALGRRIVKWDPGTPICPLFKDCRRAKAFSAPIQSASKLFNQLEDAYSTNAPTEVLNDVEQVHFVKYDVPYWGFHNRNHELAEWLEQLGGRSPARCS